MKLKKMSKNAIISTFGTAITTNYTRKYGNKPYYHGLFYDSNGYKHYGFRDGNIYLERQMAKDTKAKATHNINTYLKLINLIYQYNTPELSHYSKAPTTSAIQLYSILVSGADGRIKTIHGKPYVFDKNNNKEIYDTYNVLKQKFNKYVNRHKNNQVLLLRVENPYHYSNHVYTHPHMHGIIATTANMKNKIENKLNDKFTKIFRYKPVKCNLKPLKSEDINKFINYLLKDRKIQTKDTDKCFFKGKNSELTQKQLHLAFNAQINSAKGHRVAYYVSNQTIKVLKKKLNRLHKETNKLTKRNKLIHYIKLTYLSIKQNTNTLIHNITLIHTNYLNIYQNKKTKQLAFHKYIFIQTDLPP